MFDLTIITDLLVTTEGLKEHEWMNLTLQGIILGVGLLFLSDMRKYRKEN